MSETEDKSLRKYEWAEEYFEMVRYGAMNGHSPSHIAQLAGFKGDLRRQFLMDIANPKHKLGIEFRRNRDITKQDVESTIHFLQLQGDTDAMDVALKRERIEYISRMKEDLFGL